MRAEHRNAHPAWRPLAVAMMLLALLFAPPAMAQKYDPQDDPTADEEALPEHRARQLPADTFQPSEEISEDFPVPFPVDI